MTENRYFKLKGVHLKKSDKSSTLMKSTKYISGLSKMSNLEFITEPFYEEAMRGSQTERTHMSKKITQITKSQKKHFNFEPQSVILSEEKKELQNKFLLLDSFTQRNTLQFYNKNEIQTAQPTPRRLTVQLQSKIKLSEYEETYISLKRNIFYYTSVDIRDRYSPVTILLRIVEGDINTKIRIFASTKFQQPNRFNAEVEVSGKLLKYCAKYDHFTQQSLYLALLPQNEINVMVKVEFSRPIVSRKIIQREPLEPPQLEFPANLQELIEEIMEKRRMRYTQHNYVQSNRESSSLQKRKASENSLIDLMKLKTVKSKIKEMEFENQLRRTAQLKLHDVAKEIHTKQLLMQRKIIIRETIQKQWLIISTIVNIIAPSIFEFIEHQRTIVAKNLKKQILLIQMFNKLQKRIQQFGPNILVRVMTETNCSLRMAAIYSQRKAKRRAQYIVTDLLRNNIKAFMTESKGRHVVNLIKNCITRLVKHKNSRIEFMSDLKLFLSQQFKLLYQECMRYSKPTEPQKNRRDPIHFLLHDNSFIHQMTKKVVNHVFNKWNQSFTLYRIAIQEEKNQGAGSKLALFWQPPKLFVLPHEHIIRGFLFEELERKGLITSDFRV